MIHTIMNILITLLILLILILIMLVILMILILSLPRQVAIGCARELARDAVRKKENERKDRTNTVQKTKYKHMFE